jgi:hypothetical protein
MQEHDKYRTMNHMAGLAKSSSTLMLSCFGLDNRFGLTLEESRQQKPQHARGTHPLVLSHFELWLLSHSTLQRTDSIKLPKTLRVKVHTNRLLGLAVSSPLTWEDNLSLLPNALTLTKDSESGMSSSESSISSDAAVASLVNVSRTKGIRADGWLCVGGFGAAAGFVSVY